MLDLLVVVAGGVVLVGGWKWFTSERLVEARDRNRLRRRRMREAKLRVSDYER